MERSDPVDRDGCPLQSPALRQVDSDTLSAAGRNEDDSRPCRGPWNTPHSGRVDSRRRQTGFQVIVVCVVVVLALAARTPLLRYEPTDYGVWLKPWWDQLAALDVRAGLRGDVTNYNPPYVYLLVALTRVSDAPLMAIKTLSIAFDLAAAAVVAAIVHSTGRSWRFAAAAGLTVLLLPTVVVNGALLAQCDVIHTTLVLAALAAALSGRSTTAAGIFGLAVAVKLQAVFAAPVLLVRVVRGDASWRSLLAAPVVFALCDLPAWLAGRPLDDLASIYADQARTFAALSLNAPSLYAFFPYFSQSSELKAAGIWWAVAVCLALVALLAARVDDVTGWRLVEVATVFAIAVPLLLPAMHERYFYCADVLSVVVAALRRGRMLALPVLVQYASFESYLAFLFGQQQTLRLPAAAMVVALALVLDDLLRADPSVSRSAALGSRRLSVPPVGLLPSEARSALADCSESDRLSGGAGLPRAGRAAGPTSSAPERWPVNAQPRSGP